MSSNRLKQARLERHLTQLQVSQMTGIGNKTISDYERGITEPDSTTLKALASLYDVSIDYLLGFSDERKPRQPTVTEDDVKVALFDGDKDVTDEMWDEVTSFVEFVKQKHKKDQKNG